MTASNIFDQEKILTPISEAEPCGPSAREHPDLSRDFYAIREARKQALDAEKTLQKFDLMTDEEIQRELAGRTDDPRKPPDWDKVVQLSEQLLCNSSKDLWVQSWLIESATRIYGIVGLRDSYSICTDLVEKYWETIHPRPEQDDEEGPRYTLSQLDGLDTSLPAILDSSPILPNDSRFTWAGYRDALAMESNPPEVRNLKIDAGAISLAMFTTAMHQVGPAVLGQIKEEISTAIEACLRYTQVLQNTCGRDDQGYLAPSTSGIVQCLKNIQHDFAEMSGDAIPETESESGSDLPATAGGGSTAIAPKQVMSREDAFQHLLRVADYFRKAEPHSPVSYALEQAVRWGRMPLPELLQDLVGDSNTLEEMYKRMGIKPRNDDN